MPYPVKGFLEVNEDMVQILLMLAVHFTRDSKVEYLFYDASSGSERTVHQLLPFQLLSLLKMTFSMTLLELLVRVMVL